MNVYTERAKENEKNKIVCISNIFGETNDLSCNICRLCGTSELANSYISVFCESGENKSLRCKIKAYLDVLILKNDNLPKCVCISCLDKLNTFSDFKKMCQNTQVNLACLINSKSSGWTTYSRIESRNDNEMEDENRKDEEDINYIDYNISSAACGGMELICSLNKIDLNHVALEEEVEQVCENVELVLDTSSQEAEIVESDDTFEPTQNKIFIKLKVVLMMMTAPLPPKHHTEEVSFQKLKVYNLFWNFSNR